MIFARLDAHIHLQLLQHHHAQVLFKAVEHSREHLRPWMPWVPRTTEVAHTKAFIQTTLDKFARNNGVQVGIFRGEQIIGMCGLHAFDHPNRSTSVGYWLAHDQQGQGIMTRTVAALLDFAFDAKNMNRVELRAATHNPKSAAVAERLGFEREGVARQCEIVDGQVLDHAVYALLKSDWCRGRDAAVEETR